MKRVYLLTVVAIAVAALVGIGMAHHSGYVLISYGNFFRYESSVWATLAVLLGVWLLFLLVRYLLSVVFVSGGVVNPWSRRNRDRRTRLAIEQGQLDLAEGRWASAQRNLHRAAEAERQPLLYYLGAARAANELGRTEDCDNLLERALERQPQAELAIALSHAQLQTDRGDLDGALETLQAMHDRHPHSVQVLRQLQRLHRQRGDWSALIRLFPALRKEKALPAAELSELEQRAWGENLSLAARRENDDQTGLQSLARAWEQLTSAQRQEPQLVLAYAEQLRQLGAEAQAEKALRTALKRQYESHLARLYGLVRGEDPVRQLQTAEGWLKLHPDDPSLLLTLGRLCLQNRLWGKARDYLESSLNLQRNPETCAELARLLAGLGDTERSNQLFQEGLVLLDERLLALPLPEGVRS
ncbi:heme biosynthesis HemY N-terminal domain-containing protein [Pseudomonas defluvii]|jgi:HemY protein|uniref:heme biosynthesis HemY N-terminal domain-containing protein n=1 Tax=unclassified Pseudomonas TaxID=196821 RepID=UPI000C177CC0|nr:heme biosynthesis HemY N-terminal domain-containing protein [Pseudomonas sp. HLS-6]ATR81249.1 heme biosynthesis protein HemY [Pseudomonas sp. HLS-6]MEE3633267.1 heme biosynthesis HemY N-terminal domain-containing protein [Pseudomonas sp. AL 58]WJM97733.1 heme biosynthesis HemY N-terminal domain-containing protein [Pseudomonas defluvii]